MNVLIVLAHPEPQSFNAHLAHLACDVLAQHGHTVQLSDLYASNFDPREAASHFASRSDPACFDAAAEQRFSWERESLPADVRGEIDKILAADLVVLQFPLWWFGPPAILKGWFDRVLVYGGLYSSTQRHGQGVCRAKQAMLCVTTGSTAQACSPEGIEGDTQLILWPTMYTLRYVGFTVRQPYLIHGVRSGLRGGEAQAQQERLAAEAQQFAVRVLDPETTPVVPFNADDDWDENGQLRADAPVHGPFIRRAQNWQ
jgi:NAD(P)H dehydrogenase (quinone)